jgi:hypothetical protein
MQEKSIMFIASNIITTADVEKGKTGLQNVGIEISSQDMKMLQPWKSVPETRYHMGTSEDKLHPDRKGLTVHWGPVEHTPGEPWPLLCGVRTERSSGRPPE